MFSNVFILLLGVYFHSCQAYSVEMPTDLRWPCESNAYNPLPFDYSRLKRQPKFSLGEKIENTKNVCAAELNIPEGEVPQDILSVEQPSPRIKCLMTCILQRMNLMTKDNLIYVQGIEKLADEVSNFNPLVTSIAIALARQFNERLAALQIRDQCEAGYLINRYIAREMRNRKWNITYG